MSFAESVERARKLLQRNGRVSLRLLRREFELDDDALADLVEELVGVQRIAAHESNMLSWIDADSTEASALESATQATPEGSSVPVESPPAGAERRQLTVLFCDLVDSTRLAASLDPEDWREVLRAYQASARAVVERFDGHVAQYLGDGLLVYFGWPRAHEDDAERAVRAGLGIVEAVEEPVPHGGKSLAVRIGVHTGPVVVGEMGDGEHKETLALGDTTNVAARIQGEADPGAVLISSATLRLVSGIFVTEDLGERALKGMGEVHLHRALRPSGVRSRLDVAAATGLTPLVGRAQELGLLEDRFAQVAEGLGHAVLISGEAGIGKSRLVQAFRERLAESAHTWLECCCSPYARDSAFFPVIELQRQGLNLSADIPDEVRVERLEGGLQRAGFDLAQAMPRMASFHGLPLPERYAEPVLSPEGRRKKTLELLVEWLVRLGRLQPVVLLMEDLHWVDPSTQELVGQILERIPREQLLLLATYRPDFEPPWRSRSHLTPMLLSRLTRAQLGDLVRKAAGDSDLPDTWVEEIVRRSDGVPFFAEELTKTVTESHPEPPAESSLRELQIPESLQDSLMARLDALGPVKELAQLGSVLGREFDYKLLMTVQPMEEAGLKRTLAAAVREELFYQRGIPPDATYLFKHTLLRDAAYQSLLRSTRQRYHQRVAETLIEKMPAVADDQPELVAHHLTVAGDVERAIAWWQRAGEQADARVAHEEAIRHLRRGLSLVEELPVGAVRDEAELGLQLPLSRALTSARGHAHQETLPAWERARTLCNPTRDPARSGIIYFGLSLANTSAGNPEAAAELAAQLLRIGETCNHALLEIAGHRALAPPLLFMGRFPASREHLERAISLYDFDHHDFIAAGFPDELGITAFGWMGWALWYLGYPDRAWATLESGIELARRRGRPYTLAYMLTACAAPAALRGNWQRAKEFGAEGIAIAEEQGFRLVEAFGKILVSWAAGLGDGDPLAIDHCTAAMAKMAKAGNLGGLPKVLGMLVHLQIRAGQPVDALQTVQAAVDLSEQTNQPLWDAELLRLKGECFLQLADHTEDEAEVLFQKAIEIAQGQEARSLELRAAISLARLWQRQRKTAGARAVLRSIYDWFTESFDTQDLKDAKALLEELRA